MQSPTADGSYDTQRFIALQESLLRIPSSRDEVRATPSQPKHATDAIMLDADPLQPGISGGHVDASPSSQSYASKAVSTHLLTRASTVTDATPKPPYDSPSKQHVPQRTNAIKRVQAGMQDSASDPAHPLSSGLNDTQILPSQVYANYARSVREKTAVASATDPAAPHTLQDGESGHVRLVDDGYNSAEEPQIIDDDSADELAIETQARTENVTSPTAFSPITPAYAGNKRDARGRIITPATRTPAADLSVFFQGQPKNKVGLSQLFNQTQATSSPMPDAFHSDPVFERPSPDVNMKLQTSPSGRPSSSRTVRDLRDPRDNYVSVDESQELRKRRRKLRGELAFWTSPGPSDDEDEREWSNNMDIAKMKRNQAIEKGLQQITAPAQPHGQGRKSRRFRTSETVIGLYTPNHLEKQEVAEDLVSDELQSENNDEHSDNESQDEYDELSQTVISSDHCQTPKIPGEISTLRLLQTKRPVSSPEKPHPVSGSRRVSSPFYSPIVNVANSQPVENQKSSDGMPSRPQLPSSSNPALPVSLSQDFSLSSNTRTQLAATPLTKGIVEVSSIPPAPVPTSQLQTNQTTSARGDQDVQSSPPILLAPDLGLEQDQDEIPGIAEDGGIELEGDDDDAVPLQPRAKARLSYTVPETSPSSSAIQGSNQSRPAESGRTSGLKNGRRISSDYPSVETSNATTPFETARTTLSEDKESDQHILNQHDTHGHRAQSFHKMTDLLADPTPPDGMESVLTDINILNDSDEEFRVAVDRPETQMRRSARRQKVRDRALKEPALQLNATPSVTSRTSKSQTASKSGNDPISNGTASESVTNTFQSLHETRGNDTRKPLHHPRTPIPETSQTANPAKMSEREGNIGRSPHEIAREDVADNVDPSAEDDQSNIGKSIPPTSNPLSCRRVFTRFHGSTTLYPGTCLGFVDSLGTKFKIRFDDGTLDEVAPIHTRRLELRIGDPVKVNIDGFRIHLYIVRGLKTSANLRPSTQEYDLNTDIYGNSIAVLVEKPRASLPLPDTPQTHEIPITSLYITGTMWPQYKDREYIHASTPAEPSTRLQTPIDMHPVESPPTSRHRRVKPKAEVKFERLGLLAQGLFSNMCFAISYTDNEDDDAAKNLVSKSITRNGGLVLSEGFEELLSIPEKMTKEQDNETIKNEGQRKSIAVLEKVAGLGFTALIADTFSRRKKYLQALALDLPCLSGRWVLDSVAKGRLLPWQRYLLPAGESPYLDGETRSRTMNSYPDPSTVRFQVTFDKKPRLLDGQRIIFVPESKYAQKWQALTTLILLMGAARVRRSGSISSATTILKQHPGDWDCIFVEEENLMQAKTVLSALQASSGSKRAGDGKLVATSIRRSRDGGSVKIVSDESVIQSLILGEFIDS